jgi:hypothetical protein
MATVEEAETCPKCGQRGQETKRIKLDRGRGSMVSMTCKNTRCKWFESGFAYQLRPDGTIPDPDARPRLKQFPELNNERGKLMVQNLEGLLDESIRQGKEYNN